MAEFENKGFEQEENQKTPCKVESEQHQNGVANGHPIR